MHTRITRAMQCQHTYKSVPHKLAVRLLYRGGYKNIARELEARCDTDDMIRQQQQQQAAISRASKIKTKLKCGVPAHTRTRIIAQNRHAYEMSTYA